MTKNPSGDSPLRKLRKYRGLSLDTVAGTVGTYSGNLSRIELGQQSASRDLAAKLAEFYAPDISELHVFYPERYPDWTPTSAGKP